MPVLAALVREDGDRLKLAAQLLGQDAQAGVPDGVFGAGGDDRLRLGRSAAGKKVPAANRPLRSARVVHACLVHHATASISAGITVGRPLSASTPLFREDLFRVLDVMADDRKGVRDRALLLLGIAGGFRRS